ncbi:hypothetical protein Mgra_00004223 [Meloidogyne graminicola]|uniref:Uncharacterized protein n=1 Tax=Meloidogyne graminicola TaxID=189291 RepID=A0A8S9ZSJ2_9BILA|nr:hypothetical protein Mgra_00004223 [Meloidogyne graminicola]
MKNFNILFLFLILFYFKIKSTIQTSKSSIFCNNNYPDIEANKLFSKQCSNFRQIAASCCNAKTLCSEKRCNNEFCLELLDTFNKMHITDDPCCKVVTDLFNCRLFK